MRVITMKDLLEEYREKQIPKFPLPKETFYTIKLKKQEGKFHIKGRELCSIKQGKIGAFFKINKRVYFIKTKVVSFAIKREIYDAHSCSKRRNIEFLYISSSYTGELVGIRKINLLAFLNKKLKIVKEIDMGDRLLKNVYILKRKIYTHIERLREGVPAIEIISKKGNKKIFYLSRKGNGDIESTFILNDTVFYVGERIYITFTYPQSEKIKIYSYSLDGKPLETFEFKFAEKYFLPLQWLNYREILRSYIKDIAAVSSIFEDRERLYVIVERNRLKAGKSAALRHYLFIIDKKAHTYFTLKIPIGIPVFYDGKYFYSAELSKGSLYKWKLQEN